MAQRSTTNLLRQLREFMRNPEYVTEPIQAYIVPSNDAHSSEYVAPCDELRAYISGFTGSAGTAVITNNHACLWTDGRYYLQASQQMDSNWTLMKSGIPSTPTEAQWLSKNLEKGARIGADPKLHTYESWNSLQNQLEPFNQSLIPISTNLIALLWPDRPARPANPVEPLAQKYTGKPICEKLERVREQMIEKNTNVLVITTLDDIAWTLNLRGSDIDYNPVFFSYLVIELEKITLFISTNQITNKVKQHLTDELTEANICIRPYEDIECYLTELSQNCEKVVWFPDSVNYSLASLVPKKRHYNSISPTTLMKAVKNLTEIEGMKSAHIKDAAALCAYFAWLEKVVTLEANDLNEVTAADKLEEFRSLQEDFVGLSFATISSVGPNGAIIHYHPELATAAKIRVDQLYLCDSGGQYKDGTTDVTRTIHFGSPTDFEKECFTRVLKGQLRLGNLVFPSKVKGNHLDSFARQFLWDVGLDYGHGTGHGIGSYLNVHEGPMGISWRPLPEDPGLEPGMFLSNEPGYYQDGKFGIRLEDIVLVVEANPTYHFGERGFLTFETVTLVPKQLKMINVDMLTQDEIKLLNNYHDTCRKIVGPILEKQGLTEARDWLFRETKPIIKP